MKSNHFQVKEDHFHVEQDHVQVKEDYFQMKLTNSNMNQHQDMNLRRIQSDSRLLTISSINININLLNQVQSFHSMMIHCYLSTQE